MSSKTREALNQLLGLIDNEILVFSDGLDPSEVSHAQYQIDKADEALAAPLRNCARFSNVLEATIAYNDECPVDCDNIRTMTFSEWLFAEAEGETK